MNKISVLLLAALFMTVSDSWDVKPAQAGPVTGTICAAQKDKVKNADGDIVTYCKQFFTERPYIRPPADQVSGANADLFVGMNVDSDVSRLTNFIDRNGNRYYPVDAAGKPISMGPRGDGYAQLPASLHGPSNRHIYTIYEIKGAIAKAKGSGVYTIKLSAAVPAIELDGCAIDSMFLGQWAGTVTARKDARNFDPTHLLPILMNFNKMSATANVGLWDRTPFLKEGKIFLLQGQIVNFAATAADKFKNQYASLGNTFDGAAAFNKQTKDGVVLYRAVGMHFPGDNPVGLTYPWGTAGLSTNGMCQSADCGSLLFHPVNFIQSEASPYAVKNVTITAHMPYNLSGNAITIHPLETGLYQSACQK